MKKLLLLFIIVLSFAQTNAQEKAIWNKVSQERAHKLERIKKTVYSEKQQFYTLDVEVLKKKLSTTKTQRSGLSSVIVEFPTIDGGLEAFQVWENSNFAPELQQKYPNIRAYVGRSTSNKATTVNFSLSPRGIQTMVLKADNSSEFIESASKEGDLYVLFDSKTRIPGKLPFVCKTIDKNLDQDVLKRTQLTSRANNRSYKTLRLALSCTGEYGAYFGGKEEALAAMNATMTRVNGVYERDLAVHLNLIPNNDLVIYTNANTDPYSNATTGSDGAWNSELQNNLTNVLGNEVYDIGHLFGASGGGGNAGCIGCVCDDDDGINSETKGSGFTSPSDDVPEGDSFDIDYVAHEMGHQLGANHTFSYENESTGVQVEPGSGTTIMGYAGVADPVSLNIQDNSDPYFTYRSILQIQNNLATKTCPVSTPITNSPPVVNAGLDFSVPSGTAYILKGSASDVDGDSLTYCWEQNNSATGSQSGSNSIASATKPSGPVFRSFSPTNSPDRYLAEFSKVLSGRLTSTWESISTVSRTLKFTLTVRDNNPNGSQTGTDEVNITSRAPYNASTAPTGAGPFKVTSQSTAGITWNKGTSQTITWDVNNVTSLPGSANVNIKLSIDGGNSFPYVLASNVLNDGSEVITVPSIPTAANNCRILIEPTGNVYYAVNSKGFAISTLSNKDFNFINFSLYPNPNKGSFTVQFDSSSTNTIEITIHDLRGRSVFEKKYSNIGMFRENIKLDAVQNGIYLATIKDGENKVVKKIIVE